MLEERIKKYGKSINIFKGPKSEDWEVLLFKSIDLLHNLQREGFVDNTRDVVIKSLNPIILHGYDESKIEEAMDFIRQKEGILPNGLGKEILAEIYQNIQAIQEYKKQNLY